MKYPLVYVEWDDHHCHEGWVSEVDNTPVVCKSIGWLYKEDAKGITIIANLNEDQIGNTQYILKSCITKYKVLRQAKTKKVKNVAVADAGSGNAA